MSSNVIGGSSRQRARTIAAGVAAGLVLLGLVVGVPWILSMHAPSLEVLRNDLSSPALTIDSAVDLLSVALWLAWIWFVVSLVVELVRTRRPSLPRLPMSSLAYHLVGLVIALQSVQPQAGLLAVVGTEPVVTATIGHTSPPSADYRQTSAQSSESPDTYEHVLDRAETWWGLSERVYGRGVDWHKLVDLNPDLADLNPHKLRVGTTVRLPVSNSATSPGSGEYVVRPGDNLGSIASSQLGDPLRAQEIYELNKGRIQSNGRPLSDPDRIYPDTHLAMPAGPVAATPPSAPAVPTPSPSSVSPSPQQAQPPVSPGSTPSPAQPAATTPSTQSFKPSPTEHGDRHMGEHNELRAMSVFPWAAALLLGGAGAIALINHHRRQQLRDLRHGERLPLPDVDAGDAEAAVRSISDDQDVIARWIDGAQRVLSASLRKYTPMLWPRIDAVVVGQNGVEFLLREPIDEAPERFTSVDGGLRWRLDADVELDEAIALDAKSILPALLMVGVTPYGAHLLNLEEIGCLSVEGDPERVRAFLSNAANALCGSAAWSQRDLAPAISLTIHGFPADYEFDDDVTRSADLVAAAHRVMNEGRGCVAAAQRAGNPELLAARVCDDGDLWESHVLVSINAPGVEEARFVDELASPDGLGAAIIAAGPVAGAQWRLKIDAAGVGWLAPAGIELDLSGLLTENECKAFARAQEAARAENEEVDGAIDLRDFDDPGLSDDVEVLIAERGERGLSILGDVQKHGFGWLSARDRKDRGTQLDGITAYLLLSRHRIDDNGNSLMNVEMVRNEFWAKSDIDATTVSSAVSRVRKALGDKPDGTPYLAPRSFQMDDSVWFDWLHFERLIAAASRAPSGDAIRLREAALDLVRGEPYGGGLGRWFAWAYSRQTLGNVYEVTATIAREAIALSNEARHDLGDFDLARKAARQGLKAVPNNEELYHCLMEAAAAEGDEQALENTIDELRQVQINTAANEDDPLRGIQPETLQLAKRLREAIRITKRFKESTQSPKS